jgi:hypothetical protein
MARRTRTEQIAALKEAEEQKRQRRLALEAQEKQASRKLDTRRKIVTGAAVLAHAALDTSFAASLRDLLDKAVIKPADRELLADLLHPGSASTGTASDAPGTASDPPVPEHSAQPSQPEQTETYQG